MEDNKTTPTPSPEKQSFGQYLKETLAKAKKKGTAVAKKATPYAVAGGVGLVLGSLIQAAKKKEEDEVVETLAAIGLGVALTLSEHDTATATRFGNQVVFSGSDRVKTAVDEVKKIAE